MSAKPVAEVYRAHAGGRSRSIGFDAVRLLDGAAVSPGDELFTRATLDAAVAAARAEERERCAKLCDVTPPYPFRPSIEAAHAIRGLKPQGESREDLGKRALAKVQQQQAEAHAAAMAAAPPEACESCYGEGQQGGQFSGGFWACETCQGTGKQAAKEGE